MVDGRVVGGENVVIARSSHAFGKEVGILSLVVIHRPVKNVVLTAIRHEL
jgi:hypothetical protein